MRCILCCFFVLLGFFILPQSSISGDCIDYAGIGEEPPVPDPLAGELQFHVFNGFWQSSLATSNHLFVRYHYTDGTYPGAPDYFSIEIVPVLADGGFGAVRVLHGWVPWLEDYPFTMAVSGDYLFTTDEIYDWRSGELVGPMAVMSYMEQLQELGGALYGRGSSGIQVYDLTDPINPVAGAALFAGMEQRSEPLVTNGVTAFTRTLVEVGHGGNVEFVRQLISIDVTDPLNPIPLTNLENTGQVLAVSGTTVYLDNETELQLVDASDPSELTVVGTLARPADFKGLVARGDMFYLARGDGSIQVGDATNPAAPVLSDPVPLAAAFDQICLLDSGFYTRDDELIQSWLMDCTDPGPEGASGVNDPGVGLPRRGAEFQLDPLYPNPFNPATIVRFELSEAGPVDLSVYDLAGRRLNTLIRTDLPAGPHSRTWDGTDSFGRAMPAGMYLVCLRYGSEIVSRKAMLIE